MAVTRSRLAHELRELIAALDRRAPQAERVGEASIAKEAVALRANAMKRLKDLATEERWRNVETAKPAVTEEKRTSGNHDDDLRRATKGKGVS